jgi:prevent-host-death family protein
VKTLPISAAQTRLSELVESVRHTSREYVITVNGSPAAVLVGKDYWEELRETLFWLGQPGVLEDVRLAREQAAADELADEAEVGERASRRQ